MNIKELHSWDLSPVKARELQESLAELVLLEDNFPDLEFVAGIDVGISRSRGVARAAVTVLRYSDLQIVDSAWVEEKIVYPYIPGLLSFREIPSVLNALKKISIIPELFLCDGQGIAHPRRCGVATHLGLITDIAAIGVAKTRLIGDHDPVPDRKGEWEELRHAGEVVGAVLRSRKNVKPIFVSPGHKISLVTAIKVVMSCVTRYRLPETTRSAHRLSKLKENIP